MTLQECYLILGADYDGVVSRLMTEERVRKFLMKLPQDDSYSSLCDAVECMNIEEAFRGAHTLKGIALNLGLSEMAGTASELTEELRKGEFTPRSGELFELLKESYGKTMEAIGSMSEAGGKTDE